MLVFEGNDLEWHRLIDEICNIFFQKDTLPSKIETMPL